MINKLTIDCIGPSHKSEWIVNTGRSEVRFVYDLSLKCDMIFNAALYAEQHIREVKAFFYPKNRRFGMLLESPQAAFFANAKNLESRFQALFTHLKILLDRGEPFIEMPFGSCFVDPEKANAVLIANGSAKDKLLSFVGSIEHDSIGGYGLRREVARFLSNCGSCDVFGKGLNPIDDKIKGLSCYAFSVAMENVGLSGFPNGFLADLGHSFVLPRG